jgi:lipid-A-disaccharide synthase
MIAGEASGDLHGSNLIKALRSEDENLCIRCWGGDLMRDAGGDVVKHIRDLAFMGFVEVLLHLRTIFKNIKTCKADILEFKPDILVLIDYPGFNLRIAEWAHKQGIKVCYYISPQVWAWKQSRVHKIKRFVDQMFVILPFEKEFYAKFNYTVEYVGHPLLDELKNFQPSETFIEQLNLTAEKPVIALLPGSRKQEVLVKLPIMLEAVKSFTNYRIIVAGSTTLEEDFYRKIIGKHTEIYFGHTYDLLSVSEAALVTSGTATLETALLHIPEVVCYKSSPVSYHIAKWLIKIRYISLVNLIMDKEVVTELIQGECNAQRMREELNKLLKGGPNRESMLEAYHQLHSALGQGGASQKVARSLLKTLHLSE